jgi:hypothetical protein
MPPRVPPAPQVYESGSRWHNDHTSKYYGSNSHAAAACYERTASKPRNSCIVRRCTG